MGWLRRRRVKRETPAQRAALDAGERHLDEFFRTRQGVEAFVEQPTSLTRPSLLLIAHDGEWTRRSVASVSVARRFAADRGLPSYDAGVVPYPQRMRDYNDRVRGAKG